MRPTKEQRQERERLANSGQKRCSVTAGCGEIKPVDEFGPDKGKWDRRHTLCRTCDRNKSNRYTKENPEVRQMYRETHRAESKQYYSQYYLENLDTIREKDRERARMVRDNDPLYTRLHLGTMRAKRAGMEWENISSTELLSYWELRDITIDTCHYCQQTIGEGDLEIDHGIPFCKGGSHTLDNLFPSHKRCNQGKGKRTVEEYLEHLKQVV